MGLWRRLAFTAILTAALFYGGPARSVELDQPSSVIETGDKLPLIEVPSPAPAFEDTCRSLLNSVHFNAGPSQDMDRDRRAAGKAAALGLVFGVRFALGPKEVRPAGSQDRAQFGFWQPRHGSGAEALAIADYRRCRNEQALKAISDWRWER